MRYIRTYRATNNSHRPTDSAELSDVETAIKWAAAAAAESGLHSTVTCITTSMPDPEYGDHVIERLSAVIGAVLPGRGTMTRRSDVGYPCW